MNLDTLKRGKNKIVWENEEDFAILLGNGKHALFSQRVKPIITKHTWSYYHGYVATQIRGEGNKIIRQPAHRLILGLTKRLDYADHINRNGLDNRDCNLRVVTPVQNGHNKSLLRNNTSGHEGVNWHIRRKKWQAKINFCGERIHIGVFSDLGEAVEARNKVKEQLLKRLGLSDAQSAINKLTLAEAEKELGKKIV